MSPADGGPDGSPRPQVPRDPSTLTQQLLFDLPALSPPPDLADAYLLPSAPAPPAAPAQQLLLAPGAPETASGGRGEILAPTRSR